MVVIVCEFPGEVEDLCSLSRLPSVDELRPSSCPTCEKPSRPAGEQLGIVGHGTYTRQVLGLGPGAAPVSVHIRRYRCRGCPTTISVLPADLVPWRWYTGGAILLALTLTLLAGKSAAAARRTLGAASSGPGWKTVSRWQRQLLAPLWRWTASQLGFVDGRAAVKRSERRDRLRALLSLHGGDDSTRGEDLDRVARAAVSGTWHTRRMVSVTRGSLGLLRAR